MNTTHPEAHGPDWADSLPDEGPTCRCGFNGTPQECAAFRRANSPDTERDERLRKAREAATRARTQNPLLGIETWLIMLDDEVARLEEALRNYES